VNEERLNRAPIGLVYPPAGETDGNAVSARRWERVLRELGHDCTSAVEWNGEECSVLIALHARKSHASIQRFHEAHPNAPLVVAASGTDIYGEHAESPEARASFQLACRIIVLQPEAIRALPEGLQARARVIFQSVETVAPGVPDPECFEACVLSNFRAIKDPLRTAAAVRLLKPESRIQVTHLGRILEHELEPTVLQESADNPRFHWRGAVPRAEALGVLARSRVFVSSSLHEGGSNAVGEAIAHGIPVLATRIPGSVGLLGTDYPGYFGPGDTEGLGHLLERTETEPGFLGELGQAVSERAPLFQPERERSCWRELLLGL